MLAISAEIIFWCVLCLTIYGYIGYPFLIFVISNFKCIKHNKKEIEPSVTFLITAYNEEASIGQKLDNTLGLDYPSNKFEIIVASDGSTDRTDDIVKQYASSGVKLLRVEGRVGKTQTQNTAMKSVQGEIVVFSDATTIYRDDCIRQIVQNYNDKSVGGVSGGFEFVSENKTTVATANILYWNFEKKLKECESSFKTLLGASGCMFSIRKELYEPLPDGISEDFIEAIKIVEKGYRVVFEPNAVGYEQAIDKIKNEFQRRVRSFTRGIRGVIYIRHLLNPVKHPFIFFQLFSHKILKWFLPFFSLILLVANILLLGNLFYCVVFSCQLVFYILCIIPVILQKQQKKIPKILAPFLYFINLNIALLKSWWNIVNDRDHNVWDTDR